MKGRFLKLASLIIFFTILFSSCTKEGMDLGKFYLSYGVIVGENPDYSIKLDNGTMLRIEINRVPQKVVDDGQRVLVDYTILNDESYNPATGGQFATQSVIINYIYDILTKNSIPSSVINTVEKSDSIGHDYINVTDSWIGSDFLNVHFEIFRESPVKIHMISLIYDEERSTASNKYFILRHNAFGDRRVYASFGRVSFNIKDVIEDISAGSTVNVHLEWEGYFSGTQSETIIFKK